MCFFLEDNYFAILWWFCHTSIWIGISIHASPHPEPISHLPAHLNPPGCPRAPALGALLHASNSHWLSILYFNAILSNHPTLSFSHWIQKSVLYICNNQFLHLWLFIFYPCVYCIVTPKWWLQFQASLALWKWKERRTALQATSVPFTRIAKFLAKASSLLYTGKGNGVTLGLE